MSAKEKPMRKVLFLDRDGVINVEVNYLYRIEDFKFVPGAPEALASSLPIKAVLPGAIIR